MFFRQLRIERRESESVLWVRRPDGQEQMIHLGGNLLLGLAGLSIPSDLTLGLVDASHRDEWVTVTLRCSKCSRLTSGDLVAVQSTDQLAPLAFSQRVAAHYRQDQESDRQAYLAGNNRTISLPTCTGQFELVHPYVEAKIVIGSL